MPKFGWQHAGSSNQTVLANPLPYHGHVRSTEVPATLSQHCTTLLCVELVAPNSHSIAPSNSSELLISRCYWQKYTKQLLRHLRQLRFLNVDCEEKKLHNISFPQKGNLYLPYKFQTVFLKVFCIGFDQLLFKGTGLCRINPEL